MDLIKEHNQRFEFFHHITGVAMKVFNKYRYGLLESAYEAALKYLLELDGHKVEKQVSLPIYWDDVQLDQFYRMDLVIDEQIIIELKAIYQNLLMVHTIYNLYHLLFAIYDAILHYAITA